MALLSILALRRCYFRFWNPNLVVTFFDVGQGDSALIQFPYGQTMLIDAGGGTSKYNMGARVLFPELSRLGILTIDYLLLSHPDNDHGGGFLGVANLFRVKELWLHHAWRAGIKRPLLVDIEKSFLNQQTQVSYFKRFFSQKISGVDVSLIPLLGNSRSKNNEALVAQLNFGKCRILFTGDIEKDAETEWIRYGVPRVDLLKIPHHGSLTSSTWPFLFKTRPRWAVVSVGVKNTYGHPRKEILSRYQALGTQVLRTDFHGAVRFTFTPQGQILCESVTGACGVGICR